MHFSAHTFRDALGAIVIQDLFMSLTPGMDFEVGYVESRAIADHRQWGKLRRRI